ncbi:MAG: PilZ domain-containing protein [Candidatus Omnitrophica bacterium]|nr:PilZ domain-containing protein [Candidatus Omnitrophota bacterium]
MDLPDKRQSRRRAAHNVFVSLRPLDPQVWFRFWNGAESFTARDISLVGVGVYSREKIPEGTPLSIDLRLGRQTSSIRIFGRVEWVVKEDGQYRAGVSFSWWKDDQDKKMVDAYMQRFVLLN